MYSAFTRTKNAAMHSKDIMSNPRWNKSTLLYKKQAPIYIQAGKRIMYLNTSYSVLSYLIVVHAAMSYVNHPSASSW